MTLAVGLVGLLVLLAVLHYVFWTRRLTVPMDYALTESIALPDGARIELRRLPGGASPHPRPILLVHGVGIDHRNNDPLPNRSLARTLRARGRDVWLLRLRSGGTARGPLARRKVRFAAMARLDVPEGVRAVLARTGAARLDYVGFSMGGMLLYAGLTVGSIDPARLGSVVILGSPARVGEGLPLLTTLARLPRWLVPSLPLRWLARMFAFTADWPVTRLASLVFNPRNVDRGVSGPTMMTIESIASGLNADFLDFVRRGEVHVDGRDVLEGLAPMTSRALFVAGARDRLAPPEAVRAAFLAWGRASPGAPPETRFLLLGKATGAQEDYGHGDLAIGRDAARDVFEPVARFLDEEPAAAIPLAAHGTNQPP